MGIQYNSILLRCLEILQQEGLKPSQLTYFLPEFLHWTILELISFLSHPLKGQENVSPVLFVILIQSTPHPASNGQDSDRDITVIYIGVADCQFG